MSLKCSTADMVATFETNDVKYLSFACFCLCPRLRLETEEAKKKTTDEEEVSLGPGQQHAYHTSHLTSELELS